MDAAVRRGRHGENRSALTRSQAGAATPSGNTSRPGHGERQQHALDQQLCTTAAARAHARRMAFSSWDVVDRARRRLDKRRTRVNSTMPTMPISAREASTTGARRLPSHRRTSPRGCIGENLIGLVADRPGETAGSRSSYAKPRRVERL